MSENVRDSQNSAENADDLYQSIGGIPLDDDEDSSGADRMGQESIKMQEMEQEDYANIEVPEPFNSADLVDMRNDQGKVEAQ